jgi:hypothetical protein
LSEGLDDSGKETAVCKPRPDVGVTIGPPECRNQIVLKTHSRRDLLKQEAVGVTGWLAAAASGAGARSGIR